ncbi:drug/metabolite transporter (DMT)-like permease [Kineococcus xinjiangensis]|uniref:Drug/metabolite transporter (DMT)-like permease n=1 Tax=Kineococcus xinjiangensis TaxID=512762 RepID=A0A2S6IHV5_9ACTN|nr:DMT family transporter [Kineococcus xinjiangensis]PPK93778.1 drug/metabolite transporter (DMT)-like permease [Kineococcus xinjiangensis]
MTTPAPADLRARTKQAERPGPAVLAAVVVTVLAWASAFLAIRAVRHDFDPGALALGRLVVGALALGVVVLARRRWVRPTRREWGLVTVCGLGWFALYNVALNAAEQRLDAGTTAMLVSVGPILIALLAGAFLGEGFPRRLLTGAAVAFAGALVIGAATSRSADADLVGALLCLVAAVSWAVGVLAQKPALRRLPALQVTFLSCVVGALACLPFAGRLHADLLTAPPAATAGLLYLGLVPTAVAFGTWAYALSRTDAGRLGIATYVVPPLTVLAAWPLLGEVPPPLALAGGVLALAGVALTRRAR